MDDPSHKPGLLDRLSALLLREPEDREQLIELLHSAYERHLIDSDALSIIEGALAMSEMAVRDVMVPRAQMDMIDIEEAPETFIPFVLETAHSRFPVFEGERARDVMGVAAYTRPVDGALFAIVSRSDQFAPRSGYLHQYRLVDDGSGTLRGLKTRAFGEWSGNKEIEALSVDALRGVVFASDETFGLRKYSADPMVEDANDELAQFGLTGFARDHEGSAVFRRGNERPLLFVSDQQAGELRVFELEGPVEAPHRHALVGRIKYAARETDGIELTTQALPGFPGGLLVAMSTDRRFHFYALDELLRAMTAAEP